MEGKRKSIPCETCHRRFSRPDSLRRHIDSGACQRRKRKLPAEVAPGLKRVCIRTEEGTSHCSAFGGKILNVLFPNDSGHLDVKEFLQDKEDEVAELISRVLSGCEQKVDVRLVCVHEKLVNDVNELTESAVSSRIALILRSSDIRNVYDSFVNELLSEMSELQQMGSGWTLREIKALEVRLSRYCPLKGSSYLDLPSAIKNKEAVINVQNKDQQCFKWAVLSALHPVGQNASRVSKYQKYSSQLDFSGISFPVDVMGQDIPRFEKNNGISINVFGYTDDFVVYPLYITDEEKHRHVNLLYLENGNTSHYCWIRELSRLVSRRLSKNKAFKHICNSCLSYFGKKCLLDKHKRDCRSKVSCGEPSINMPDQDKKWIHFKNFQFTQKIPFVVYADFECYLKPIGSCAPSSESSYTNAYQQHVPMSFCYYIVSSTKKYSPVSYRGPDAASKFLEYLTEEAEAIGCTYADIQPMALSKKNEREFEDAKECYLCRRSFRNRKKVKDHCHLTGVYRGPACNACNLKCKRPFFVPVFIHNMTNYDLHLFIKEFGSNDQSISVLAQSEEKYISVSKVVTNDNFKLRFLDSFRFLPGSLDSLSKTLSSGEFYHTRAAFPSEKVDLLLRKGVYPYDYMTDESKCADTCLPPKECFYNELNERDVSEADYEHAQDVWEAFGIKNLGEYSDLYVKSDVLLLADVFENFRQLCFSVYGLDPAWYYTAPGLSWDAMLKMTKIDIELLTDKDMLFFVEKGVRGGLSQCSHRYAKANNKYMSDHDPQMPSKYLLYLDANNLYGWAMSQCLPVGNFSWSSCQLNVMKIDDDSPVGYILEVDLKYPKGLHDAQSELPFAPERKALSEHREKRLLATLYDKQNYVIHYRNLKQCVRQGLLVTKIHRVLQFDQRPWLAPYIELNTEFRSRSGSDFEKNFYKLMNNVIYGKTMENVRLREDIRLCSNLKKAEKLMAKPNFKSRTIFSETLVAIHMNKISITFNKPVTVGMSILDISKVLMYDFHYDVMKSKYGDDIKLLYTDTDSLIYSIQTDDAYEDMKENIKHFDTSDFPENNPFNMPLENKKVLGKMKDECGGRIVTEFVGLRSKMYAFKIQNSKAVKKLKGVKKACIENKISFEDYYDCLFGKKETFVNMNRIRSKKHDVSSVRQNKLALSDRDEKRHVDDDNVHTLAFGHYKLLNSSR